ncbi:MAG: hypothetical protein PHV13_02200 [Candidatus ainarchaeum sp.]|nr:hypothetical protein [Candidatus ainarchaeum sp.]
MRPLTKQQIAIQRREETIRARHNGHARLPGAFDRSQNRPWTELEYGGKTPQQTFAAGNSGKPRCLVHGIIVV